MSSTELAGRVALIAGGTGPIGRATARNLAARGASVAILCRSNASAASAIASSLPTRSLAVLADLGDRAAIDDAFAVIETQLGGVDILVNAAHAGMPPTPFGEITTAQFEGQFAAAIGHAHLCQAALAHMRRSTWGRIVYISGALMTRPAPGFSAYGAAKSAATTLTRYLALEEGHAGITANVVAPGRVVDPHDSEPLTPEWQVLADRLTERMALGVFPTPADVADVVGLLVGSGSGQLTGQTVWVTGGEPIV